MLADSNSNSIERKAEAVPLTCNLVRLSGA